VRSRLAASRQGLPRRDAQQPRPQRGRIAKRPDSLPGTDHGVDHDLLGIGVAAQDVEGDALNQAPVLFEQPLDRLRVPGSQVLDQPLVQLTPAVVLPIPTPMVTNSGRATLPPGRAITQGSTAQYPQEHGTVDAAHERSRRAEPICG